MKLIISVIIFFMGSCSQYPLSRDILYEIYPGKDFKGVLPKVVYHKSANLLKDKKEIDLYVLRDKNEETICIINNNEISMIDRYILLNYGPMKYNIDLKNFELEPLKEINKPFIIQDISFHRFEGDQFDSLFFLVFSEEPPLGFFLVPMIYRDGVKIFDGLNYLVEEEFLKKWKKTTYSFNKGNILMVNFPGGEQLKYLWKDNHFVKDSLK